MTDGPVIAPLHDTFCEIPFLPGARELLTDIRAHGVPCAMYTSSNKRIMSVIARVVPEFEFIVDGDDVKNPKPDQPPCLLGSSHPEAVTRGSGSA